MSVEEGIIYIVTSGDYSDYGIDAVYLSRIDAEEAAQKIRGAGVEEWILNEPNPRRHWYQIEMTREGIVYSLHLTTGSKFDAGISRAWWGKPSVMHTQIRAENEEQAIKAANEQRAKFIAEGKWPEELLIDLRAKEIEEAKKNARGG